LPNSEFFDTLARDEGSVMGHSYDLPVELVLLTYESLADEFVVPRDRRGPPLKRNTT
jgi:hypothetical protein